MDTGIHGFTDFLLFVLVVGLALLALLRDIGRVIAAIAEAVRDRVDKPVATIPGHEILPLDILVALSPALFLIIPWIVVTWLNR